MLLSKGMFGADGKSKLLEKYPSISDAPVVAINSLVPEETCRLTLVFAGPAGQQKVITREVTTRGWD